MMLADHLRHLPSLTHRSSKPVHLPQTFNRVMHFNLLRNKRHHVKHMYHIQRADTEQHLYAIHKTPSGLKLVDVVTNATLFRATINNAFKTVSIRDEANNVLFTTRQHGELFAITDVFKGEHKDDSIPYVQVCAGSDYSLTEASGRRVLAVVEREILWSQLSHHSVYVDGGLNAPLFLLLIVTINHLADA